MFRSSPRRMQHCSTFKSSSLLGARVWAAGKRILQTTTSSLALPCSPHWRQIESKHIKAAFLLVGALQRIPRLRSPLSVPIRPDSQSPRTRICYPGRSNVLSRIFPPHTPVRLHARFAIQVVSTLEELGSILILTCILSLDQSDLKYHCTSWSLQGATYLSSPAANSINDQFEDSQPAVEL